jgi:NNP family nitrate/nitrite transporter-like MFS transporter
MFGVLVDLTGVRSSAFMLMFGVVWVSLMWMYWTEVRPMDADRELKRMKRADLME